MKLKWKFKIFFFMLLPLLYMADCESSCKTLTGPDPPGPPPEPKYYTIQIRYVRPPGSILRPDFAWKSVDVNIIGQAPNVFGILLYDRTDDYNFNWSEPQLIPDNETSLIYSMWGLDTARWDSVHDDTAVVGDIFFVRVKETGFEKQLTNIMQNNNPSNPYKGPNARMVQWRLKRDGTISDN